MSDPLAASAPHNLEIEQGVLGALIFDVSAFERLPDELEPRHFYEPIHASIYEIVRDEYRSGRSPDVNLLAQRLKSVEAMEALGGIVYLADLGDKGAALSLLGAYARQLMDLATRRRLLDISGDMGASVNDYGAQASELIEAAEAALFSLAEGPAGQDKTLSFAQAVQGAVTMAMEAYSRDGSIGGLSSGLIDLDQKLGGLHDSDLLILAGRPSMGKTALATNIAFNVAQKAGPVHFFSLEMSAEQLASRILADRAGVSSDRIRKGSIDATEAARLHDAAVEIESAPLFIDATGGLSISKLVARARRQKRKAGTVLIVVDYLQLITTDRSRQGNRTQEVSEITQALKALAKELNVPVLALSQLSRQVESRDDKRPQLSDLRESGSIEQDADAVMFVFREEYYLARTEPKPGTDDHLKWSDEMSQVHGLAEIIVGKQRHGPIGTVKVSFSEDTTRFGNIARDGDYAHMRDRADLL